MSKEDPTTEELWWAQQIQLAYLVRFRALKGRSYYTLNGSEYEAPKKWITPALHAMRRNIQAEQFVDMVFSMCPDPLPWQFIMYSGKLKTDRIRMAENQISQQEYIRSQLKWSMQQFMNFGKPGTQEYYTALIDIPEAIGVPGWIRVLLGFDQPEVCRAWRDDAMMFFSERPDIVNTCLAMGFPPQVLGR